MTRGCYARSTAERPGAAQARRPLGGTRGGRRFATRGAAYNRDSPSPSRARRLDRMKALVYVAPERLEIQDIPEPAPAEGEVLLEISAAGVCGSDIHGFLGH